MIAVHLDEDVRRRGRRSESSGSRPGRRASAAPVGDRGQVVRTSARTVSMLSSVVLVVLPGDPVGHLPFQNGRRRRRPASGPSRRTGTTAVGSCRISADSLSIGWSAVGGSRSLLALTPATEPRGLGLARWPTRSMDEVGLEGLHLGPVGERRDELATAEHRLARRVVGRAGRRRRRRRPRPTFGALGPVGRVEGRLTVHVALAVEDRLAAVLEGRRGDAS